MRTIKTRNRNSMGINRSFLVQYHNIIVGLLVTCFRFCHPRTEQGLAEKDRMGWAGGDGVGSDDFGEERNDSTH
jgi:hypothetical protein